MPATDVTVTVVAHVRLGVGEADDGDGVDRRATATADAGNVDQCRARVTLVDHCIAPTTSTDDARRRTGGGALTNGGRGWYVLTALTIRVQQCTADGGCTRVTPDDSE